MNIREYVQLLMKNFSLCLVSKYHSKLFGDDLFSTLKRWMTPEVPTGPETSPVDTTPLPILFVARCDIEHHFMDLFGISLCYCPLGYLTAMSEYIGTHT